MKIAQVCPRYYPDLGGVETHVKEISERLVQKGNHVQVICTANKGRFSNEENINGVQILRFKTCLTTKKKYFFAPRIYAFLKKNDFDIIHAHNFHSFPALLAALSKKKRKYIFTPYFHTKENLIHLAYKPLGTIAFKRADKIISNSKYEKDQIQKRFKVEESKIVQIPSIGIHFEEFKEVKPWPDTDKTLLYIGRLEKYKGVQFAINVLKELPNYKLIIIGKGNYLEKLKRHAKKIGVLDRISWLHDLHRSEILRYYISASVFLMLSRYESYGITTAESLASGTPCIVARGSALEDFIDEEYCIGLDYPIQINDLKEAILKFEGLQSITFPVKFKTWNEIIEDMLNVYNSVL